MKIKLKHILEIELNLNEIFSKHTYYINGIRHKQLFIYLKTFVLDRNNLNYYCNYKDKI